MAEGLSYAEARERMKTEPRQRTEQQPEGTPPVEDMRLTLAAQQQVIVSQQTALAAQVETIAAQRELIAQLKTDQARLQAELVELRQMPLQQTLSPAPAATPDSVDQPSPRLDWRARLEAWIKDRWSGR